MKQIPTAIYPFVCSPWRFAALLGVAFLAPAVAILAITNDSVPIEAAIDKSPETAALNETPSNEETIIPDAADLRFIRVTAGSFTMGSPPNEPGRIRGPESPEHTVTLSRDYDLAQTPITWKQWILVRSWATNNGYDDLPLLQKGSHGDDRNSDDDPVTMVSWWDAVQWLNAKSEMTGKTPVYYTSPAMDETSIYRTGRPSIHVDWLADGYRLPTEAEWEYAGRAGTTTAFYTGPISHIHQEPLDPNLDLAGWYSGNSEGKTHPVGQKEPNAWGLFDMHGNVWEWCWNYQESYGDESQTDPVGPVTGQNRVRRGGSWQHDAFLARSAYRLYSGPLNRLNSFGFRAARNADPRAENSSPSENAPDKEALESADQFSILSLAPDRPFGPEVALLSEAGKQYLGDPVFEVSEDGELSPATLPQRMEVLQTANRDFFIRGEVYLGGTYMEMPYPEDLLSGFTLFVREKDLHHRYELNPERPRTKRRLLEGKKLEEIEQPFHLGQPLLHEWTPFSALVTKDKIVFQIGHQIGQIPGPLDEDGKTFIGLAPGSKLRSLWLSFVQDPDEPENSQTSEEFPSRTWTDVSGRTLQGALLGFNETSVTIRRDFDKRIFTILLETLSEPDREIAADLLSQRAIEQREEQ